MKKLPPFQGIVFDLDGTLLDSEVLYERGWRETIHEFGISVPGDFYLHFRGLTNVQSFELITKFWAPDFDRHQFERRLEARTRALFEAEGISLKPGVLEILEWCQKRTMPCAIATSTPTPEAKSHLDNLGILDSFVAVCGRDLVVDAKPAPEIFLLAASKLGVEPQQCLAVEDSGTGMKAAHAAGMITILITGGEQHTHPEIHDLAHKTFPTLHELRLHLDE